jgi:hypothetical protein
MADAMSTISNRTNAIIAGGEPAIVVIRLQMILHLKKNIEKYGFRKA